MLKNLLRSALCRRPTLRRPCSASRRSGALLAVHALFLVAGALLSGCAAMEQARLKQIDESVAVTAGTQLGRFRRIGLEQLECTGKPCTPELEASLTRALAQHLTQACYAVVDASEYGRYAEHFARRVETGGRKLVVRTPRGTLVEFTRMDPELREVLVEELQLDGVVMGTIELGQPDDITKFRPATATVKLVNARSQETVWHVRLQENVMGDDSVFQDLDRLIGGVGEGIRRRASRCAVPGQSAQDDGIEVVQAEIRMRDRIFFELDSDRLSPSSTTTLDRLAAFLKAHPELIRVRVEGHTDDLGEENYNRELSSRRAEAVLAYLIARGIETKRLSANGYGEARPLVPNTSEVNRSKNRRVEIKIVERRDH